MFGFNNNLTIGYPDIIYYITHYVAKDTTFEDVDPYLTMTENIQRHLQAKQQREQLQRQQQTNRETYTNETQNHDNNNIPEEEDPFITGLKMVLSGIRGYMIRSVISARLAHQIILRGERFQYSHDFGNCLVKQLIQFFDNEQSTVDRNIIINTRQNNKRYITNYTDTFAEDYLLRHDILNIIICLYFFVQWYERRILTIKQRALTDQQLLHHNIFRFQPTHPYYNTHCMKKRKKPVIPIIYGERFPNISTLEFNQETTDPVVLRDREIYASLALHLFLPFRTHNDFPHFQHNKNYWEAYIPSLQQNLLWPFGLQVLQNIQDRYNMKNAKFNTDDLLNIQIDLQNEMEKLDALEEEEETDRQIEQEMVQIANINLYIYNWLPKFRRTT